MASVAWHGFRGGFIQREPLFLNSGGLLASVQCCGRVLVKPFCRMTPEAAKGKIGVVVPVP